MWEEVRAWQDLPSGAVLQAVDSGGVRGKDGIVSHPHKGSHQNYDMKKTAKTKHIKIKGP